MWMNKIFRLYTNQYVSTEITDYRRSTERMYPPIRTEYALRLLGKILFVIVVPISVVVNPWCIGPWYYEI